MWQKVVWQTGTYGKINMVHRHMANWEMAKRNHTNAHEFYFLVDLFTITAFPSKDFSY